MHRWDENLKITQARLNKWGKKEFEEKCRNLQHNFEHLMNNLEGEDYELELELVNEVDGHEDTIQTLLKVYHKKKEQEEFLQNNPPESFISRVAKERVEIKKRKKERSLKLKNKLKTKEQIKEEKKKERLEDEKKRRIEEIQKQKERRQKEKEEYQQVMQNVGKTLTAPVPLYK